MVKKIIVSTRRSRYKVLCFIKVKLLENKLLKETPIKIIIYIRYV